MSSFSLTDREWSRRDVGRQVGSAFVLSLAVLLGAGPGPIHPIGARAASCNGASHALQLDGGTVAPASGTTSTAFAFAVRYIDNADCPPTAIAVTVVGLGSFGLAAAGSAPAGGTIYRTTMALPVGTWTYRFSATSGTGVGEQQVTLTAVSPTPVVVSAPATPRPTPAPTPRPTPPPTAPPPTAPPPTAPPTPPPTGPPTAAPTPIPSVVATSAPSQQPPGTIAPALSAGVVPSSHVSAGTSTPDDGDRRSPDPMAAVPNGSGGGDATAHRDGGLGGRPRTPVAALVDLVGAPALLWAISTLTGSAFLVVMLWRPRRRLEAAAVAVTGLEPHEAGLVPPSVPPSVPPADPSDESALPRWLRPSLRAARRSGAMGPTVARAPLQFGAAPDARVERRTVQYRLVRVGDGPDDIRSAEVGRLERGDEVDVLDWRAGFALVRAPDGLEGWVAAATILTGHTEPPTDE